MPRDSSKGHHAEVSLIFGPRRRKRYVKIFYRTGTDHNWSTDGIVDLFGTFHLFKITRTVTPGPRARRGSHAHAELPDEVGVIGV